MGITLWFHARSRENPGMAFHRGRKHHPPPKVIISGHEIEFKACFRFLGMMLNRKLKWLDHIESLRSRCLLAMNDLKATVHLSWDDVVKAGALFQDYIELWSEAKLITYGFQFHGNASDSVLRKLDVVHNYGICVALGAFRSSPIASLHAVSGDPLLQHRCNQLCLQLYARLQGNPRALVVAAILNEKEDTLRINCLPLVFAAVNFKEIWTLTCITAYPSS